MMLGIRDRTEGLDCIMSGSTVSHHNADGELSPSSLSKKSPSSRKRKSSPVSADNMIEVRKLHQRMQSKAPNDSGQEVPDDVIEVEELGTEYVIANIEGLVMNIVSQILETGTFEMAVPNRSETNQKYIEALDRNVLGKKISKRSFLNTSHVRKTAITTRVMQLVHEVLTKGIHITKRDLFYTDVKLFKEQGESDAVLDDVACMVGCTRTSLHVVASDKVRCALYSGDLTVVTPVAGTGGRKNSVSRGRRLYRLYQVSKCVVHQDTIVPPSECVCILAHIPLVPCCPAQNGSGWQGHSPLHRPHY